MFRALLTGLGAGATAMYFYDPVRGEARREQVAAKVRDCLHELSESATVLKREAEAGIDRVSQAMSGQPRPVEAAHAASDESPLYSSAAAGEESWPPAAEAAFKLGSYAVLGKLALGRAFWPAVIGGSGLYWAAKQGAFNDFSAAPLRDLGRSFGQSLGEHVRGLLPGRGHAEDMHREIGEIMSTAVAWCTADSNLSEAARLMREHDCGAIPVVDDGVMRRPVGVITDRDIAVRVVAEGRNTAEVKVRDCMSTPVATAHRATSLCEVMHIMEDSKLRRMVIVDDDGRVCGMVAQADLAREAPQEQVGEVVREVSERQTA
ncbi:MAG: CBS domain-containing protein [Pirellulales bacterium]